MTQYDTGEYVSMGNEYAFVISGDNERLVIGITENQEILVDLQLDDSIHSLGHCPDAPMPPEDDAELNDFDWHEWGEQVREALDEQGFFVKSTKLRSITVRG